MLSQALRRSATTAATRAARRALSTNAVALQQAAVRSEEAAAAVQNTKLYINGEFIESQTDQWIELRNPATQELVTRVPQATPQELAYAADSAAAAFKTWKKTSVLTRQRKMLDLQLLIRDNMDAIAASIVTEQGKTFADAKGDVMRGLQVVESLCGAGNMLMGEQLQVATDMDTYTIREPLASPPASAPSTSRP